MTYDQLIKQAYAYGITVALQEAGYEKTAADNFAVKAAAEASPALLEQIKNLLIQAGGKVKGVGEAAGSKIKGVGSKTDELIHNNPYAALGIGTGVGALGGGIAGYNLGSD